MCSSVVKWLYDFPLVNYQTFLALFPDLICWPIVPNPRWMISVIDSELKSGPSTFTVSDANSKTFFELFHLWIFV